MKELHVIVTGGRDYTERKTVFRVLDMLMPYRVAQGECPTGADLFAREWAKDREVPIVGYPPTGRWPAAGPRRNRRMLRTEVQLLPPADLVVCAFPGNKGTANCIETASEFCVLVLYALPWRER